MNTAHHVLVFNSSKNAQYFSNKLTAVIPELDGLFESSYLKELFPGVNFTTAVYSACMEGQIRIQISHASLLAMLLS